MDNDWVGLKLPDEYVAAPEEYNSRQTDDEADIKIKTTNKPKKIKWDHNPMEE
ncbi:hypothetical protein INT45_008925 [Circinella minor]|uniref:Uncharacterized protein n=1 Tax=Circinella minor TaxID=1195481 RepID=A0A8H7S7D8_9FUNG|nr:hypothetical protein INT45_008925 [Circinella minor]